MAVLLEAVQVKDSSGRRGGSPKGTERVELRGAEEGERKASAGTSGYFFWEVCALVHSCSKGMENKGC